MAYTTDAAHFVPEPKKGKPYKLSVKDHEMLRRIAVATGKMASDFDALYFASQRTGASVGTIKSFGYAVSQLGGSAEGASSSLENLGVKIKMFSAVREQVESLAHTKIKDGVLSPENLEAIGAALRKMPLATAYAYGESWGMDQKTINAMIAGVEKYTREYDKTVKNSGLDPEKAARDANRLATAWRSAWLKIGITIDSALARILGGGGNGLEAFGQWFDKHSGEISKALADIAQGFASAFGDWQDGFGKIDWKDTGKDIGEFAKNIAYLVKQFTDLVTWVLKSIKAIEDFLNKWTGLDASKGKPNAFQEMQNGGDVDAESAARMGDRFRGAWNWTKNALGFGGGNKGVGGWWTADRQKFAVDYLMKKAGLSQYGAAGLVARWAAVEAPGGPTSVNPTSGAAGIAQWLGSRKDAAATGSFEDQLAKAATELNTTERRAGDALRAAKTHEEGSRGASMFERAEGYNPQTGIDNFTAATPSKKVFEIANGAGASSVDDKTFAQRLREDFGPGGRWSSSAKAAPVAVPKSPFGTIDPNWFHAPAPGQQHSFNDNSSSIHAPQTTNINVSSNGSADAESIARHVAKAQGRVNADLVRNMQGAVA